MPKSTFQINRRQYMPNIPARILTCIVVMLCALTGTIHGRDLRDLEKMMYTGVGAGIPVITGSTRTYGHGIGFSGSVMAGISLSPLLSAEIAVRVSHNSCSPHQCCINSNFWHGADGNRYIVPAAGISGVYYNELTSSVISQHYRAQLNINLLNLWRDTDTDKWSVNIAPLLSLTGSRATVHSKADSALKLRPLTTWHFGYGAGLNVMRSLSTRWAAGLYSEVMWLTGRSITGWPDDLHHTCPIWDSGIRVCYMFNLPSAP